MSGCWTQPEWLPQDVWGANLHSLWCAATFSPSVGPAECSRALYSFSIIVSTLGACTNYSTAVAWVRAVRSCFDKACDTARAGSPCEQRIVGIWALRAPTGARVCVAHSRCIHLTPLCTSTFLSTQARRDCVTHGVCGVQTEQVPTLQRHDRAHTNFTGPALVRSRQV